MSQPILTVIVPAYDEAPTIGELLNAIAAAPYDKQVIVVDDGSNDGTWQAAHSWRLATGQPLELVRHRGNRGKGAAIRTGLAHACGDVVLIQDADLEYDPSDYPRIVGPILAGESDIVYGSRYLSSRRDLPWTLNRVCVVLLNYMVRGLFGVRLTDEATCYKAFRTELLRRMELRCEKFDFCPEVTAKAARMGIAIREVPISYVPRTRGEGKKIQWKDGVHAIATLLRWRIVPFHPLDASAATSSLSSAGRSRPLANRTFNEDSGSMAPVPVPVVPSPVGIERGAGPRPGGSSPQCTLGMAVERSSLM
jgi:dolichol-phosphate mannosyltransferase